MATKSGVSFYVKGISKTEVNFPDGDICCRWCPYCKSRTIRGHTRVICVKTYEALENIDTQVGEDCVLNFEQEDET